MNLLVLYVKESYNELINKVTWPTLANLQSSTTLVLVASLILSLIIFVMDVIAKQSLGLLY